MVLLFLFAVNVSELSNQTPPIFVFFVLILFTNIVVSYYKILYQNGFDKQTFSLYNYPEDLLLQTGCESYKILLLGLLAIDWLSYME